MLSENWITDKTTDFEYKKYTVLAYLQSVYKSFNLKELYPVLPSLDNHHNQLELFIHNKQAINQIACKRIKGIDWKNLKLNYDHEIKMCLPHIDRIVDFTLPLFKNAIENGVWDSRSASRTCNLIWFCTPLCSRLRISILPKIAFCSSLCSLLLDFGNRPYSPMYHTYIQSRMYVQIQGNDI